MLSRLSKLTLILSLLSACLRTSAATSSAQNVNGVMAIVNDYIITVQEVYMGMQMLGPSANLADQKMRDEVLKLLIDNKLILSDFQNAGFAIPDSYFDDAFEQNIKERFDDRTTFIKTLQSEGKHLEEVKAEYKEQMIINIMKHQKIGQQISVSPYKIERFYEEHQDLYRLKDRVNLRMIIIPSKGTSDATARARAEMVLEKILAGGDFADLAREGGLLGWQDRDVMRREIAEVAFEMEVGETSNLVATPNAIFIFRVEKKESEHVKPLSEVREDIERDMKGEQEVIKQKQWIDELRKKSFIRTF